MGILISPSGMKYMPKFVKNKDYERLLWSILLDEYGGCLLGYDSGFDEYYD